VTLTTGLLGQRGGLIKKKKTRKEAGAVQGKGAETKGMGAKGILGRIECNGDRGKKKD